MDTVSISKPEIFISHAKADRPWLGRELLPRLEEANLVFRLDYIDFKIGAPKASEIVRFLKECKRTILVISPAYVRSEWSELEFLLMTFLDPAARRRKCLPILWMACEVPVLIEHLVYVDLTEPGVEYKRQQWQRILSDLKDSVAEDKIITDENKKSIPSLDKINEEYIKKIERKLRMEDAHWLRAGFAVPSEQFSFAAVYFHNQMDALAELQSDLRAIRNTLNDESFNISSDQFRNEFKSILDKIELRAFQVEELLYIDDRDEVVLAVQETINMVHVRTRKLRKSMHQAAVSVVLHPAKAESIYRERRTEISVLEVSIQELLASFREIYIKANNGTVFVSFSP